MTWASRVKIAKTACPFVLDIVGSSIMVFGIKFGALWTKADHQVTSQEITAI